MAFLSIFFFNFADEPDIKGVCPPVCLSLILLKALIRWWYFGLMSIFMRHFLLCQINLNCMCQKVCCIVLSSSSPYPTYTFFLFLLSSPLLRFEMLTKAICRASFSKLTHETLKNPEKSSPPCFFSLFFCVSIGPFISSNVVSLTPSTNRKRCCENEVLMLSVRACSALGLALTGHCNGWIQKELFGGARCGGILQL